MSKQETLMKNTAVYAIGNFGSKVLSYIMVVVYSYYILPDDMGYYDLILTTVSMLQPVILLQLNDGIYRFLLDRNIADKDSYIGTSFRILCSTTFLSELLLILIVYVFDIKYGIVIGLYLASSVFFTYSQSVIRGCGGNKLYAAAGIANSFIMLFCEVVGLIILHLGVVSLLISKVIANITCIVMFVLLQKNYAKGVTAKFNSTAAKPLLKYSLPLIPNTICWWIVNSSDRYIILFFLGSSFNGIFSMAYKFPTVLTTITSIFYLAWQESALKEYDSPGRDEFFSDIFHKYYVLLFTLSLCAIPATQVVIELFVSAEYKTAWIYTGFLFLGAVFNALCSFLGMGYQISKETKRSLATTVFAAMINIGVNIAFIRVIGLQAASMSTFVAYLFLFIIRIKHTKRYFTLTINWRKFIFLFVLCFLTVLLTLLTANTVLNIILTIIFAAFTLYENKDILMPLIKKLPFYNS